MIDDVSRRRPDTDYASEYPFCCYEKSRFFSALPNNYGERPLFWEEQHQAQLYQNELSYHIHIFLSRECRGHT